MIWNKFVYTVSEDNPLLTDVYSSFQNDKKIPLEILYGYRKIGFSESCNPFAFWVSDWSFLVIVKWTVPVTQLEIMCWCMVDKNSFRIMELLY